MPETAIDFQVLTCTRCGTLDAGGRASCPFCGGTLEPRAVSGRGTLVTWTLIRRPPAGIDLPAPYAVAVVELAEGVRITARLARFDPEPALGSPVQVIGVDGPLPVVDLEHT